MNDFLKRIADFSPKRLLLLAAELEERVRSQESRNHTPIAIVGIGCRFPGGVRDPQTFWELLSEGRDAITEVPPWRWDVDELYDPDPNASGRVASRWGGFIESPDLFDPGFFGIAPIEADSMDPQQRLLLEVSWEALEDAAIVPASLAGSRTGVFVGLCNSDYAQRTLRHSGHAIDTYFAQGASHAVASGRISYFLGLRGPSVSIDTACSSSLVAIHQACQSLRIGETDAALAGGANLLFSPEVTMALSRAQMMAPDGRCKAFSSEANGFVRSEGCGMIVLKRLEDAERDKDRVIAVIRGSAVNQDGRSSGITAPNGPSQEDVIRAALADAHLAPASVGYVEAHGTGTQLGDPIELRALNAALGPGRPQGQRLAVGSVKSNFGHAESAAGVAGLIKLVLSLQHKTIPASLHFLRPNAEVDWESSCLRVPTSAEEWQVFPGETQRVGAVSSFGFSGTNAHLVISESLQEDVQSESKDNSRFCVFPLSARSERALQVMAAQLADTLREDPTLRLQDVAYTLAIGRSVFPHRAALATNSRQHLIEELSLLAAGSGEQDSHFVRGVVEGRKSRIAFLFAGQGGEHTGMGLSLLEHSAVFRDAVAEVDAALSGTLSVSIATIFRNEHDELSQSSLVQPALYAFQYGLARVWQSSGIEPHIVVGHSMGEILACTLAGVLSVRDASLLIAARGKTTGDLGDAGGMVAVAASEDQALAGLANYAADVSIAAINSPTSVVISGRLDPLEQATQEFERAGYRVKRLNITYGSHSPAMHRVLPAFYQEAVKASYQPPRLPILADLTGAMVEDASTFSAQYFTSHLARPVQFHRCLERLALEGCGVCIEMGPRAVLTTFGKERGEPSTRWIASANGREEDFNALQAALAEAFVAGAPLDWNVIYQEDGSRKVSLPTYPFERDRYWIAGDELPASGPVPSVRRVLPASSITSSNLAGIRLDASLPLFEMELKHPLPLHLAEHRVGEQVVLPASVYLSLAWNAWSAAMPGSPLASISSLAITRPLQPGEGVVHVQTSITPFPNETARAQFRVSSRHGNDEEWTLHAVGMLDGTRTSFAENALLFDREAALYMSGTEFYERLAQQEVHLEGAFRAITDLWYSPGAALGRVLADEQPHRLADASVGPHPALLDACFQVLGAAGAGLGDTQLRLMTSIESVELHGELHGEMLIEAQIAARELGAYEGSILVRNVDGLLLASAHGILLRPIVAGKVETGIERGWLYEHAWQPAPLPEPKTQSGDSFQWTVLGSSNGVAAAVADRLVSLGHQAEAVTTLAQIRFSETGSTSHEIVDLRPIDRTETRRFDPLLPTQNSAQALSREAISLTLENVQLWQHLQGTSARLWLFTQGAQSVRSSCQASSMVQSTIWGFARCATLEDPLRLQRIVDLDPATPFEELSTLVVRELLCPGGEEQVAYAGSSRLVFRLKPSKQTTPSSIGPGQTFHKEASYVLTGGVGGLGLKVAEWVGRQGAGRLILTTRSPQSVAARQAEIDALRESGIDIEIVQADVADSVAMRQLFTRFGTNGDLPPLRGIFHMAAAIDSAAIADITEASIQSMFRAKVQGTWILHECSKSQPLDFFAAFSSTSAVLGASHLGNYAAANSFLDAMASLRAAENLPFTSINWGTWQTMRLATVEAQQLYSSGGMLPMKDETALAWLGSLLQSREPACAMVAHVDWATMAPLYEARRKRYWLEFVTPKLSSTSSSNDPLWHPEPGESRLHALERAVQKEAARVLGFRRGELPSTNARLADLGLDSLMAVNLRNRLQALIGHMLPPTFAFEHPTPAQMAMALDLMLWSSGIEEDLSATDRDEIQI